ncbi:hypothetical protein BE17_31475 [Sorangium cellulosum]|uniref:Uncharacterized protein n=1 Tax=Sorangium cellulosum TaxID=56 RepID=A0A150RP80_SORCE|nr:hypothetical protein BE17_31475 [Sorangium cellulosum]
MTSPAFRKASSRRRLARMSKLNSTVLKMTGSGLKEIFVPVLSVTPIALSGAFGTPRAYS